MVEPPVSPSSWRSVPFGTTLSPLGVAHVNLPGDTASLSLLFIILTFLRLPKKSDVQPMIGEWHHPEKLFVQEAVSTKAWHFNQECLINFASHTGQSDCGVNTVNFFRASRLVNTLPTSFGRSKIHWNRRSICYRPKLNRIWIFSCTNFSRRIHENLTLFRRPSFFLSLSERNHHSRIKIRTEGLTRYQFLQDLQVVHNLCKPSILKYPGAADFCSQLRRQMANT